MTTMLGPPHPVAMPTVTKADKLRLAAAKGEMEVVHELLELGTPPQPDKEGRTPLHFAAQNGHLDICQLLIQHGCRPDDQDHVKYTALHRASSQGHTEVIQLLIDQHCNIDIQDENGNAAIHEAAWHGFSRTLDILIKYDCNIVITNKAGFTALHLSAQNGHNQSTRILLLAGCNPDIKNNYGDTALHTAARYGHAGVTRILISARCSLNEQNKNGDTALHIASALKRRKIAKLLVDAGIDVKIKNKQEETAKDVAERKQHPEIILIISSFSRPKTPAKTVNFKEYPIDLEGPVVVPEEEVPPKPVKQEKKFFDFFKKKKKDKEKDKTDSPSTPNTGKTDPSVQGFFSQYVPKPGVQYYRDLAGNIKQGPIGYTPICQCMPTLKKLEHQVHTNHEHIYDHIEASHRALNNRLNQIDQRTTQQVREVDQRTSQRLAEEEVLCQERLRRGFEEERAFIQHSQGNLRVDIHEWLEDKLGSYGHCLEHHHDDTALPSNNIFSEIHQTENGRLFRSRSDETLSQSDNHSGKGFRKKAFYESRQQAMQQIRAWQMPSYSRTNAYRVRGSSHNVPETRTVTFSDQDQVRTNAEVHISNPPRELTHVSNNLKDSPIPNGHQLSQNSVPTRQSEGRPPSRNYSPHPLPRGTSPSVQNRGDPVYGSFRDFPHTSGTPKSSQNPKYEQIPPHSSRPTHMNSPYHMQGAVHPQTVPDYRSPHQYSGQGAVPKRIPQSQTWHHEQYRNMQNHETNPKTQGVPVNQEQVNKSLPRSQTDNSGAVLRSSQAEVFRRGEAPRQSVPERGVTSNGFVRNIESRQSFPERGPSNTNSGGNLNSSVSSVGAGQGPQDSSRPSSGRSDRPFIPPKPTFTTFGYDNTKPSDKPHPSTSVPNSTSDNVLQASTPRPSSNTELESPYAQLPNRSRTPHDELDNKQTYSYFAAVKTEYPKPNEINKSNPGNETPRDDLYVSMSEKPIVRQRARSSEGLLDSDITSAHDLKKFHPPSTSFASNPHISDKSQIPSQRPQPQPRPSSRPNINPSMNQYSSEARNSPLLKYGNQPVPNRGAQTESGYMTMKGPYEGRRSAIDFDKKGGPYRTHGNIRENPYASVRDVSSYRYGNGSPMGKPHSTYLVNPVSQGQYSLSKSESNLLDKGDHSDDEGGFTTPRRTMLNASPAILRSANSPKAVSNYPNAYNKEDSSSNPDSGYSSKILGSRANNGNVPSNSGTPSSSFSTDHDHSLSASSNNHSPHPAATHDDYEQIQDIAQAVNHGQNLQAHVEGWYQKKLKEAAVRLQEGPYNEGPRDKNYNPPGYSPHNMNHQYQQHNPQYHSYQANQTYNNFRHLPSYIRGSDV